MSTLTKVLVLLVSALSIFLSGVYVLQLTTGEDLKSENEIIKGQLRATQTQSFATEDGLAKGLETLNAVSKIQQNNLALMAEKVKELQVQRDLAVTEKGAADATASRATELANTLAAMNANMQSSEVELFKQITDSNNAKVQAEIKNAQLNQKLANVMAESEQKAREIRRLKEADKLKDDVIADLKVKLESASLSPTAIPGGQGVKTAVNATGVPIRGEILEVRDNGLVLISVGTSSGVREGMVFHVARGAQFLSDMVIKAVYADQAVGELYNTARGEIVLDKDTVSTGYGE
ncbi:MAG: hypothetical protein JEZ07_13400 [Phycisphaerae bacterium]|nr:hypothetical protein [Phycisphaerae bacterium]